MKNIVFIFFLTLISCDKNNFKADEFTLIKENYNGNQLQINGYFFYQINDPNTSEQYYNTFVFFQNGICLKPNSTTDTNHLINDFINKEYNENIEEFWGLYNIENSKIRIEYYGIRKGAWSKLPVYLKTGTILNDTTFVITEEKRSKDGSEYRALNDTFHFVHYQKPDSTNNFIK